MDDTDLLHTNLDNDKSVAEVHIAIQNSVHSWGNLLTATDRALQPSKCFYYYIIWRGLRGVEIHQQLCQQQLWSHHATARRELSSDHTPPCHPHREIIGSYDFPWWWLFWHHTHDAGKSSTMGRQSPPASEHLVSPGVQFWPWVGYNLCNLTVSYKELEQALHRQYYQILLLGGIIRTAPLDWRMVNAGFYCPGLPHPGVEAIIAMTNKLLMYFGCRTAIRTFLSMY